MFDLIVDRRDTYRKASELLLLARISLG